MDSSAIPVASGQLVRVYMENFMTYDSMEVKPGFHLNLVIGPNGSGKSAIVCAVLLALNGKLKTLGRADQLSSYVKSGREQCFIEVELYSKSGKNVVIRRQFSMSNQSQFFIGGKPVSGGKVNEVKKEFNIQVDNLCTFLPQEKVQDFAKMNSMELLEQTEKAVGTEDIAERHDELKKLRHGISEQEQHNKQFSDNLESEKQKNERLKDRVRVINEKKELLEKIKALNQKKSWMEYHEAARDKKEVDDDAKLAKSAFNEKQKSHDKVVKQLDKLEASIKESVQKQSQARNMETRKRDVTEEHINLCHHSVGKLENVDEIVRMKMVEETEKKEEMRRHEVQVDKLQNDLSAFGRTTEADVRAMNDKITNELRINHDETDRLTDIKGRLEDQERALRYELRSYESERRLLEQRRNTRVEYLRKNHPDVSKACEWLEQNMAMFRGNVYRPMLLEINVPNSKMAKYVESHIPFRDLISFTCTCPEDVDLLVQKLRVEQGLRVNIVSSSDSDVNSFRPNIPLAQIKQYGFHSYLKDFIVGPDVIICYLCALHGVHNIPVGNERVDDSCDEIPDQLEVFYSATHVYRVSTSYYSQLKSTEVVQIMPAKLFSQSVDEKKIEELKEKEAAMEEKIKKTREETAEINKTVDSLGKQLEDIRQRKRKLATKVEERALIVRDLERAKSKVDAIRRTIINEKDIETEAAKERQRLSESARRYLQELREKQQQLNDAVAARCRCELNLKCCRRGVDDLTVRKRTAQEELHKAQETLGVVQQRQKAVEATCRRLRDAAKLLTKDLAPGDAGFARYENRFRQLPDTVDELEALQEETQAMADFLQGGGVEVLQEYEARVERIAQMTEQLELTMREVEEKKQRLAVLKELWLEPVQQLVAAINNKFTTMFSTMGCVGEVALIHGQDPDDFEQYGIQISVKFRDNMPLQVLSRHFQSGGERAVTTAIYMLSLQELTNVPFRFVDEINQGMDPINERRILELIIQVTAPVTSLQYFFITPKLLKKIEASNTMTVLCIYNGPGALPSTQWDNQLFIERVLAHRRQHGDNALV